MEHKKQRADLTPKSWPVFYQKPTLWMKPKKILTPQSEIFTIGSCFAHELQKSMLQRGVKCHPEYKLLKIDSKKEIFDNLDGCEFPAHYDSFVIRQEFDAMLGLWPTRGEGFAEVIGDKASMHFGQDVSFQDPYRRRTYAATLDDLRNLSDKITQFMLNGLAQASVVVITLGQTEVWKHTITGHYWARMPGSGYGGNQELGTFRLSTFLENYNNVKILLDNLFHRFPDKQVVLTVSPIPLVMTHSTKDVGTATLEGKSILRAVAGQIEREYENVTYFPAYEMATLMRWPVFQDDGRHILPEFVGKVVEGFLKAFS